MDAQSFRSCLALCSLALPCAAQAVGQAKVDLASLPLGFEANHGQTDARVDFLARSEGYVVFLEPAAATISLSGEKAAALRLRLIGSQAQARSEALGEPTSRSSYFVGGDASGWVRDAPVHARVRYADVWPGIDLVYHGKGRQLEYDFVVAPGVDPDVVRFEIEGEDAVAIGEQGELAIQLAGEPLSFEAPVAYQEIDGERRAVGARYRLEGDEVRFELGEYDRARELVIDPVIVYSTFLGTNGSDKIRSVVLDDGGNAYVTGSTSSTNFPVTLGAFDTTGSSDAFVAKISASGSTLLFSTYLGGSGIDAGSDIALSDARVWIVGETTSTNFPGASANAYGGARDGFLAQLSLDGSALHSSCYIGSAGDDLVHALAVRTFAVGYYGQTQQRTYVLVGGETTGTFDGLPVSGVRDGFVMLYHSAGVRLWSKVLRGTGEDAVLDVDARSNVLWIGGHTAGGLADASSNLWISLDSTHNGGRDGFLTRMKLKLDDYEESGFSVQVTSAIAGYLGGSGTDQVNGLGISGNGSVYVAGSTTSANFPIKQLGGTPVLDATFNGATDAFVAHVQVVTGHGLQQVQLRRSTFLGGSGIDEASDIDPNRLIVVGRTASTNYPTAGMATTHAGGLDAFVTSLDSDLSTTSFSILRGGQGNDMAYGVSSNLIGRLAVAGDTMSASFPATPGAFDASFNGGSDGFLLTIQFEVVLF